MKLEFRSAARLEMEQVLERNLQQAFSALSSKDSETFTLQQQLFEACRDHMSLKFLSQFSSALLANLLEELFFFINARRSKVSIRVMPIDGSNRSLLLSNCPDAPYLLHSAQSVLVRHRLRFQVAAHPIITVRRTAGSITELAGLETLGDRESLMVFELVGLPEKLVETLQEELTTTLESVLKVAEEGPMLQERMRSLNDLAARYGLSSFWQWLQEDNFKAFAYRCVELEQECEGGGRMVAQPSAALGLESLYAPLDDGTTHASTDVEPLIHDLLSRFADVVLEETDWLSPIYRSELLQYVGIREALGNGHFREHVFLGLFTDQAISSPTSSIPVLRSLIARALDSLHIPKGCHDYRKTLEIVDTFPKADLFFMDENQLKEMVHSFTQVYRHSTVKVVANRSLTVHGLTLLLTMPRRFYSQDHLTRMESYLCRCFRATSARSRIIHIAGDYLSLHVNLHPQVEGLVLDIDRLERGLTAIAMPWDLKLRHLLDRKLGVLEASGIWERFHDAFSREYRTLIHPRFAIRDIFNIEKLLQQGTEVVDLWGPFGNENSWYRFQVYSLEASFLNDLMPVLENLNLCVIEESDFLLKIEGREVFLKSFALKGRGEQALALRGISNNLLDAFRAVRDGLIENDYLNRLLVLTGLSWKQIDVFRGYRNYYFQLGNPFTKRRVAYALINHPLVTKLLYDYFEARFQLNPAWADPLQREIEALSPIRQQLVSALETVSDTNEDLILRTLFNLIDSTVRTNFFLRCDKPDYFFSFKISAIGIIDMPAPRPMFEIYVHAAHMEGIHLRGGKVARGGLRLSDRPDDFRTEVLGLMKTQMIKNTLIVPVGSKGGFVIKDSLRNRPDTQAVITRAYTTLIEGLLDLTDNRKGAEILAPAGVVCYDDPDPYLVVAADKGTARMSDTANAISRRYGFWLDDAFASGGSQGYDHKQLAITAKGGWESVKRHFRELGRDVQTQPFTVVGIGDMSGDVFGNGMLLSRQIRLLAAFDHRHIFLDPDPDPEVSFLERQRLFQLPSSSWQDYDLNLISEGGGVYPRSSKEIPLSPQVRTLLSIRHDSLDGQSLIRLLLFAHVDLLWNGGIGTYVKASTEKNEEVGDRANDGVRIDAGQLRARVVGEGGNLGFTQKARIEYALAGGRINTDALDNSGGVDCSDHEVNLKILMQLLLQEGDIALMEERNALLQGMTEDIIRAVLANNYGQNICMALDRERCRRDTEPFFSLSERLSRAGLLDRKGENLPSAKEVMARKDGVYVTPELSTLLSYSKMQLYQALLESELPEKAWFQATLSGYFPARMRELFGAKIRLHPLAREITATVLTNNISGQAGAAFINQLVQITGCSPVQAAEAYLTFDAVLGGAALRAAIYRLDNIMPSERQYALLIQLEDALAELCSWALVQAMSTDAETRVIGSYTGNLHRFVKELGATLDPQEWRGFGEKVEELVDAGLLMDMATQFALLPLLDDFLPQIRLQSSTGSEHYLVAKVFKEVRRTLGIAEIIDLIARVPVRDRWDRMAKQSLLENLQALGYKIAEGILSQAAGNPEGYFAKRRQKVRIFQQLRDDLRGVDHINFHPFTALIKSLQSIQG